MARPATVLATESTELVAPNAWTETRVSFVAAETNEVPVPKPADGRHRAGEPSTMIVMTCSAGRARLDLNESTDCALWYRKIVNAPASPAPGDPHVHELSPERSTLVGTGVSDLPRTLAAWEAVRSWHAGL